MIKEGLIFTLILLVIDYVWLGLIAKDFYVRELGALARMKDGVFSPNLLAGGLVYIAMFALISVFLLPKISGMPIINATLIAFIFGASIYAIYDFTNMTVLTNWSWKFAIVDTVWGGVLVAITVAIAKGVKLIS